MEVEIKVGLSGEVESSGRGGCNQTTYENCCLDTTYDLYRFEIPTALRNLPQRRRSDLVATSW